MIFLLGLLDRSALWPVVRRGRTLVTLCSQPQLRVAVCLERPCRIAPALNLIEETMHKLYLQHEIVKSLYSDHEVRHFEDLARAERLASRQELDEKDIELSRQASAQDFVDASKRELEQTPIGSTITLADKNNDTKSLDRQLDRRLLLLVQQKVGSTFTWLLPTTNFDPEKDGKYLIKSAERAVKEVIGDTLQCRFMGNAPSAVFKNHYSPSNEKSDRKSENDGQSGPLKNKQFVVTFIYKAHLLSGTLTKSHLNGDLVQDFAWLTREEAKQLWTGKFGKSYSKCLAKTFLQEHLPQKQVTRLIAKYTNRRSSQQRSSSSLG